jgi:hypothetical protein
MIDSFLSRPVSYPSVTYWRIGTCLALLLFLLPGPSRVVYAQTTSCVELVSDNGFENGQGWVIKSHGNYSVLSDVQAHTGAQSAYLAGMDNADDLLLTKLVLPTTQQSLSLSFWWKVNSEDVRDLNDKLSVQVADGAGKGRQTVLTVVTVLPTVGIRARLIWATFRRRPSNCNLWRRPTRQTLPISSSMMSV